MIFSKPSAKCAVRFQPALLSFESRGPRSPRLKTLSSFERMTYFMEKKPSAQKLLIMAGILTLTLVAFFAGGVALSSAHAESQGKKPGQQGTPGPANGAKTPELANGASGTITNIDGSTITVQAGDQTFTILVTDSTTFSKGQVDLQTHTKSSQPASFSNLAVGETIQAYGTVNRDGSLTASKVVIMPSGVGPSDGGTK